MATAGILNFFNTQKLSQYKVDIPTKCHEVWWTIKRGFFNFLNFFHQTSWNIVGTNRNWWNLIGTTSTSSGTR
jgi:hypothetical protein